MIPGEKEPPKVDPGHLPSANEPQGSQVYPANPGLEPAAEPEETDDPDDPDDIEDEIDAEIDDGDIEMAPKKKKKKKR